MVNCSVGLLSVEEKIEKEMDCGNDAIMDAKSWNNRPIEQELEDRIAELEDELRIALDSD